MLETDPTQVPLDQALSPVRPKYRVDSLSWEVPVGPILKRLATRASLVRLNVAYAPDGGALCGAVSVIWHANGRGGRLTRHEEQAILTLVLRKSLSAVRDRLVSAGVAVAY